MSENEESIDWLSPRRGAVCICACADCSSASPCMNRTDSRRMAPCRTQSAGGVLKSCGVCSNGHTLHTYSLSYRFLSNQLLLPSAYTLKYYYFYRTVTRHRNINITTTKTKLIYYKLLTHNLLMHLTCLLFFFFLISYTLEKALKQNTKEGIKENMRNVCWMLLFSYFLLYYIYQI